MQCVSQVSCESEMGWELPSNSDTLGKLLSLSETWFIKKNDEMISIYFPPTLTFRDSPGLIENHNVSIVNCY